MTIRFVFLIVAAAPNSNYSAGFIAVKLNLLVGALCLATTASSLIAYIHLTWLMLDMRRSVNSAR